MYFNRSEYTDVKGDSIKVRYQTFFTLILYPACRLQRFGNLVLTLASADNHGMKQETPHLRIQFQNLQQFLDG